MWWRIASPPVPLPLGSVLDEFAAGLRLDFVERFDPHSSPNPLRSPNPGRAEGALALGARGSWKTGRESKRETKRVWVASVGSTATRHNEQLVTSNLLLMIECSARRRDPGLPMQGQERARLASRPLTWPALT